MVCGSPLSLLKPGTFRSPQLFLVGAHVHWALHISLRREVQRRGMKRNEGDMKGNEGGHGASKTILSWESVLLFGPTAKHGSALPAAPPPPPPLPPNCLSALSFNLGHSSPRFSDPELRGCCLCHEGQLRVAIFGRILEDDLQGERCLGSEIVC